MKRVVINQSNYIPWKGYFDLIHDADVFIFYDDVQFTKNDWRNRNKVKTADGCQWLSVPVGRDLKRLICSVGIASVEWQETHWKTLRQLYGKAPYFSKYKEFFEHVYLERRWERLSELNQFLIVAIARDFLGIRTQVQHSSDVATIGSGQDRVLTLLTAVGAERYISGPSGAEYLDPQRFVEAGIELVWKNYAGYPEYQQFHPPFEHAVTVLDLLFHTGPEAPYFVWGWRTEAAEMAASAGVGR